jgi:hypothetical protein
MTGCLEDKALFLLTEGEVSEAHRSHLQSCRTCAKRYDEIQRDLRLLTHTLAQEQPSVRLPKPKASIFYRSLPIAAGALLAVALMWGESRRPDSSSEQALNGDVSQFLQQVAEAIDGGTTKDVRSPSSDTDLATLQVALGENCSDECRDLSENFTARRLESARGLLARAPGRETASARPEKRSRHWDKAMAR